MNTDGYLQLAQYYTLRGDEQSAIDLLEDGIAKISSAGDEEGLELLNSKLENVMLDAGFIEGGVVLLSDNLSVSIVSSWYDPDNTFGDEFAVGSEHVEFSVEGPGTIRILRIIALAEDADVFGDELILAGIEDWKLHNPAKGTNVPPYTEHHTFPVKERYLGKTVKVLLVGMDENMDYIGKEIITVQIEG